MTQLAADCALLEDLRVMDYSLLLGIHARSTGWMSSPHATDRVRTCYLGLCGQCFTVALAEPYTAIEAVPVADSIAVCFLLALVQQDGPL